MSLHVLTALAMRLLGVFLLYYCLVSMIGLFSVSAEFDMTGSYFGLIVTPMVMTVAASLCMIAFPVTVSRNLVPLKKTAKGSSFFVDNIEIALIAFIALFTIVKIIFSLLTFIPSIIMTWKQNGLLVNMPLSPELIAKSVMAFIGLVVGLWVLFHVRQVRGLLKKMRGI